MNTEIMQAVQAAEAKCKEAFDRVDQIAMHNTAKVLDALQRHQVAARHFAPTTGYGYDDIGRDTLGEMIADVLNVTLKTKDIDYDEYVRNNPRSRPFLYHRIYLLDDLRNAGLHVPDIPLAEGLKRHTLQLRQTLRI